ncbi:MAG: alpha-amylase, partial [Candidatus Eisenbacteria bacterium]
MNNPDERTAVEQFGKGDKYVGVCLLMVTMPGLPMFGHGQIEGFTEKYGMEYRRAYLDEPVDEHLVRRHEAEIFPLMRRRRLFSGAENFALFDFVRTDGVVDENVFAYTNQVEGERALILYNNVYERTAGTIHTSTAINVGSADSPRLVRRSLSEALALDAAEGAYYAFRDHKTGLEYLRSGRELAEVGLFAELSGYEWHAFIDWREIRDADGRWGELARRLGGRPAASVERARREMELAPVLEPYRLVLEALLALVADPKEAVRSAALDRELRRFLEAAAAFAGSAGERSGEPAGRSTAAREAAADLALLLRPELALSEAGLGRETRARLVAGGDWREDPALLRSLLLSAVFRAAESLAGTDAREEADGGRRRAGTLIDEWFLDRKAEERFAGPAGDPDAARLEILLAQIVSAREETLAAESARAPLGRSAVLGSLFADPAAAEYLVIHEHEGVSYLIEERLEGLTRALVPAALLSLRRSGRLDDRSARAVSDAANRILAAGETAGYRVAGLLGPEAPPLGPPKRTDRPG